MPGPIRIVLAATLTAALGGCLRAASSGEEDASSGKLPAGANVTVLSGNQLTDQRGSLLDAMLVRVPGLKAVHAGNCPSLTLRGEDTMFGPSDPMIYVNGTRTQGTCILTELRAIDVSRVEVYPLGFTTRPGYSTDPNGLILVFLRDG